MRRFPSAPHHRCVLPGGNILLAPICARVGMAPTLSCCLSLDSFSPYKSPCQAETGWSHQQLSLLHMRPFISLSQFSPLPHSPPPSQGWCLKGAVPPNQLSIQPSFHPDLLKSYITPGFNFLSPSPASDTAEQPVSLKNQPHSSHLNGFKCVPHS